ncbi:MAG TPA: saccharopine dehydrogenase NADP-binding domain-containing protein [Myxococcota bacterium]|nr:saccharopine dehydrogenase NADP-binding domain-containing protein [Myxococcota bacterium]
MASRLLIYGANGYTGRLVCDEALRRGLDPIVAGRNGAEIGELARRLGVEHRVFSLEGPSTVDACLDGVDVVIHCAGPFSRTAMPMAEGCLRTHTHYLDVTGEVDVFERLASRSSEAALAGVMWMPGVGFDVVPSDCLAVHAASRSGKGASGRVLRLAILGAGIMSHGTATTMIENLHKGGLVRRGGALVPVRAGSVTRRFDFGRGEKLAMAVPWGDLATAYRSTGIGDIETYFAASGSMVWGARAAGFVPWLMKAKAVQGMLKRRVEARPAGPSEEQRKNSRSIIVAEVEGPTGTVRSRLTTPNGYTLTALASVEIARRVLAGEYRPGFQTPAQMYGADFVLGLQGVSREDL